MQNKPVRTRCIKKVLTNPLAVQRNNNSKEYKGKNNFTVLRKNWKITITRHSKLSAADQEGLRSRAEPKDSYPGLKTRKYSRIENVHTHIP
jgi:hypothetical protein